MKSELKNKALSQLKKADGMLKKVTKMVEGDVYCINILQQSLAVIGFMKSANRMILENHLNSCFKKGMLEKSSKKQNDLIQELIKIMNKT